MTMASLGFASGNIVFFWDVEHFIAKREGCYHFRGEVAENNDKKRQREIQASIKKLFTRAVEHALHGSRVCAVAQRGLPSAARGRGAAIAVRPRKIVT